MAVEAAVRVPLGCMLWGRENAWPNGAAPAAAGILLDSHARRGLGVAAANA
eukprot:CAMPEP_0181183240 /NCGR_PEP_ID=MMETSP1096-20121128/8318_1 /TAXON_ID=156174 ORGANISM="Chrysochromulina ericina, Strain CCMP281" /NCGR_SAMPLE_ID=MMETSP1096 /ASSEMBLY_ACC=CAM_ASM_000453 /LENGTH=50 /DNA_ID=CAMNT_0023271903 /DNA_START=640 /DNA_END=789 /DNA_ORIENTATION=-